VLGGQIVAELSGAGAFTRGFVYLGGQLLAVQQSNQVSWMHQDPLVKSKRVTNSTGNVVSTIELDPWGGDTNRSSNEAFQPRRFTTYDRDGNASDDAMHRRYNRWHSRFDQPDPYGGSYDITNPQSFNRYSYVQNDPVNFVDPRGLCPDGTVEQSDARGEMQCVGVGVNGVTINISGGGRSSGAGGASDGPIEIETTGNGPTQAEIVPQNPASIDNKGSGQDCNISIAFSGDSVNGMKNGKNYFEGNPGLGFTVSISGLETGGVASIGENKVHPNGRWVLQQLMNLTYWTLRQGDTAPLSGHIGTFSDPVHPNSIIRNDNKSGGWIDHPGPNMKNKAGQVLVAHHSRWNFLIKAFNGKKECHVGFHAEMTYSNGSFIVNWGPGLY
jgi:RHS repeat-associated protein